MTSSLWLAAVWQPIVDEPERRLLMSPLLGAAASAADAGEAKAVSDGPSVETCHLAPHEGVVFLDRVGEDEFVCTHTLTQEVKVLPPGQWHLEFDDESGHGVPF